MSQEITLNPTRKGAWIVNISKHLQRFDATNPGLYHMEHIIFAGKCGSLLIKVSADSTEQLNVDRIRLHAQLCGISSMELPIYLETLESVNCLAHDRDKRTYEILALTRTRVLSETSRILEISAHHELEESILQVLEFCLRRPRLESELNNFLSSRLNEVDAELCLGLIRTFGLLGTSAVGASEESLYFNTYQFGDRAKDIGNGLSSLNVSMRDQLNSVLDEVYRRPGVPLDTLRADNAVKDFAIGLGLVDVSEVASASGGATFLTPPRMAPPSVGQETSHLEDDVFHHAKMLLSSLRYGQLRSLPQRGRIFEPDILMSALLERERVGPCTAIGQDYVLLEGEGVIRTIKATHRYGDQFFMEIRRREPAEIVLGLLQSGQSSTVDAKSLPVELELPHTYSGPEMSRAQAMRQSADRNPETVRRFLEELRT